MHRFGQQTVFGFAAVCLLAIAMLAQSATQRVTVIDTGSTNRPGLTVTADSAGNADVTDRTGANKTIHIDPALITRMLQHVEAARPLSSMPSHHCMKSASFGSSLFIEFNGERSPDLSCPSPGAPAYATLQKDAQDLLDAARSASGLGLPKRIS